MSETKGEGDPGSGAAAMQAVAHLYHAYFTGLILTLVTRRSASDAAEWVFHHEKFLSSFGKLGLTGMPDAVACALITTCRTVSAASPSSSCARATARRG
jgi:hypothetical protein